MKKRYTIPLGILLLAGIGLAFGPKPNYPTYNGKIEPVKIALEDLNAYIKKKESKVELLKKDNEARIIWADSIRKTPYSIVYLHGFSASPMEGRPVHQDFAKRYGANLYLARLAGHGIDSQESFVDISPKAWIESAKEAIAIGQLLGEKVILMSCSTGSSLSLYLTANNPELVEAQIMYSPNIALYDSNSKFLTYPWGGKLAQSLFGGNYREIQGGEKYTQYWTTKYRIEGILAMLYLLDQTMTSEIFSQVKSPLFAGFYYKNEEEQDKIISTKAIREMFEQVTTPTAQKHLVEFPDVNSHVIASDIQSKDIEGVKKATYQFVEEVLNMKPVEEAF